MKGFLIGTFLVLLLLPCLFSCRCHRGECYITIYNKSDSIIGIEEVWNEDIANIPPVYQDYGTVFPVYPDSFRVFKSSEYEGWEDDFKFIPFIRFLVMDYKAYRRHQKYDATSVDSIRKHVPIYHYFDLILEDLEAMKYKIVYPPEEKE